MSDPKPLTPAEARRSMTTQELIAIKAILESVHSELLEVNGRCQPHRQGGPAWLEISDVASYAMRASWKVEDAIKSCEDAESMIAHPPGLFVEET